MADSVVRSTLARARYLLRQANICGWDDPEAFAANLEAAIQFGRNVTWRMQHAYHEVPGFAAWYEALQEQMLAEPLFPFFNKLRVRLTKRAEAPVRPRTTISTSVEGGTLVFGWLVVAAPPEGPWHRWSWRDMVRVPLGRLRRPIDRVRLHARMRLATWRARWEEGQAMIEEDYYFDDPAWKNRPCRDLVREYLDRLERIVDEAEARFGQAP